MNKPILTFALGAVGAAVLVYALMRPASAPDVAKAPAETQTAAPVSENPEPAFPDVGTVDTAKPVLPPKEESRKPAVPTRKPVTPSKPVETAENRTTPPAVIPPVSIPEPQTPILTPAEPREVERPSKPVRVPQTVTIPSGTSVVVRIDQALSSKTDQAGNTFKASLDQPLVVDGFVIAEKGARVEGKVATVDPGGRVKGKASLSLELVRLTTSDGQRLRLQTDNFSKLAASDTKGDLGKVGIAAGIGAAIGAIAGGGKGAAIGAGVGGAAGTGGVMATRGKSADIAAETRMTFKLREAIVVTEKLP